MPEQVVDHRREFAVFRVIDGVRTGLWRFCGSPVRVSLATRLPDGESQVHDYQGLVSDHRAQLADLFRRESEWTRPLDQVRREAPVGTVFNAGPLLPLNGVIGWAAQSRTLPLQLWLVERPKGLTCDGPILNWLQTAAWQLAHEVATNMSWFLDSGRAAMSWNGPAAIAGYAMSRIHQMQRCDAKYGLADVLAAIAQLSLMREEGQPASGRIAFVDRDAACAVRLTTGLDVRLAPTAQIKHMRKLLQVVEGSGDVLLCADETIVGACRPADVPPHALVATLRGGAGWVQLGGEVLAALRAGQYSAALDASDLSDFDVALSELSAPSRARPGLRRVMEEIVKAAQREGHGCTLVLDIDATVAQIHGHALPFPVDLRRSAGIGMAMRMARVDGALHVRSPGTMHAFGCLLDGDAVAGESLARGARYNSALRFTSTRNAAVVVVSEDGPISVFCRGRNLSERSPLPEIRSINMTPPSIAATLGL